MIILGIDPGLAHTGWGVVETRGTVCRARAYGCIATKADEPIDVRLGRICRTLGEVIEKYGPTELAIESIYLGAAIVACSSAGLKVGEYTPMQIKQAVVGTGAADKHQVAYMVRSILALDHEPRPDHAADALAAAVCYANVVRTTSLGKARRIPA